jgi:hypothetical protein
MNVMPILYKKFPNFQTFKAEIPFEAVHSRTMEPPIALTILPFLLAIFIFAAGYIVGKRDKRNLLLSD